MSEVELVVILKSISIAGMILSMIGCVVLTIFTAPDFFADTKTFFKMSMIRSQHYYTNTNFQVRFDEVVIEFLKSASWTLGPLIPMTILYQIMIKLIATF